MEFTNQMGSVEAYRQGQFHGAVAGIIVSTAVYYLYKAYKPGVLMSRNTPDKDRN